MADGGDGGTSLGGEGFLATFAAVSDVKNDMNWEDIIPLDERQKFEKEEDQRKAEEIAAEESRDRKRTHAPVSYEGMDVDQPPAAAVPKKPKVAGPTRKTLLALNVASGTESASTNDRKPWRKMANDSDAGHT